MRAGRTRWISACCAVFFVFLAVPSNAGSAQRLAPFTLPELGGGRFTLDEHIGKEVLLVTFFATWCEPCAREHPHLQKIYQQYATKGLLIIAISIDEPGAEALVKAHKRRYGLTFPILLDQRSEVARIYAPEQSLPLTLLVGKDGAIHRIFQGYTAGEEKQIAAAAASELALKEGQ